jgi:glycosyltransferase involved in cell wall biosynthesis
MMDKIAGLKLIIIGDGPLRGVLEHDIEILGVGDRIQLLGFIPDHHRAEEIISKCGIGLAPYEPVASLARYTEPSKPKTYMACGLPVIITRVPRVASDIEKAGAGIVIDYDDDQFMQAVARLSLDRSYFDECRRNALEFVSQYQWTKIYSDALGKCNLP